MASNTIWRFRNGLSRSRLFRGTDAHIIDIIGDRDLSSATIVNQIHSCLVWLETFGTRMDKLEIQLGS